MLVPIPTPCSMGMRPDFNPNSGQSQPRTSSAPLHPTHMRSKAWGAEWWWLTHAWLRAQWRQCPSPPLGPVGCSPAQRLRQGHLCAYSHMLVHTLVHVCMHTPVRAHTHLVHSYPWALQVPPMWPSPSPAPGCGVWPPSPGAAFPCLQGWGSNSCLKPVSSSQHQGGARAWQMPFTCSPGFSMELGSR